ncbi:VanW family protein [Lysinibacillus boronitolerans]|uniref:VanW family protein n=1 Tax=Lysinibacillus boronitolerans TaxID=309788 RepID=UPI002899247E|nr:VanW family protein [Lysinibacillus boronitolerans]
MKLYFKLGSMVVVLVVLAIWLPNQMMEKALATDEGSTIGGINVQGLEDAEIQARLQESIDNWKAESVVIEGAGVTMTLDPSMITFDLASSIAEFHSLTAKPWYAFWQQNKNVHIPLHVTVDGQMDKQIEAIGQWDVEKTLNEVITEVSYLKTEKIAAIVANTYLLENERIALSTHEIPTNLLGVSEVVDALNNTIITPNETFSLLTHLGETADKINMEGLNFVSSLLYHVVLQTEYEIVERHAQEQVPMYLQKGIDAWVNGNLHKDLQFMNLSEQSNIVKLAVDQNSLKVELFAPKKENEVSVRIVKDKIVQPRMITRYSKELAIGQEKVLQQGKEGVRVEVFRSIMKNGSSMEELISRDYYAPINQIVMKSSKEPVIPEGNGEGTSNTSKDPDLQLDLDGDGLPDMQTQNEQKEPATRDTTQKDEETQTTDDPKIVYGYYDKGGNFVQTSP